MAKADARLKPAKAQKAGQIIASLDIGTSKITCLIGRNDPAAKSGFSFLGGGRQQSRGFKDGSITDMEALGIVAGLLSPLFFGLILPLTE